MRTYFQPHKTNFLSWKIPQKSTRDLDNGQIRYWIRKNNLPIVGQVLPLITSYEAEKYCIYR